MSWPWDPHSPARLLVSPVSAPLCAGYCWIFVSRVDCISLMIVWWCNWHLTHDIESWVLLVIEAQNLYRIINMPSLTLELRGFKLANRDLFSKSDPYFVISRQSLAGGWNPLRTSETIKVCFLKDSSWDLNDRLQNNLNPVWRQITLLEQELPSEERKLRIEVYDDDGKLGPDASDHLIGEGYYSVEDMGMFEIVWHFWCLIFRTSFHCKNAIANSQEGQC